MTGSAARDAAASIVVREAHDGDLPAIQAIYAYHVMNGLGTFEEEPPDLDEMRRRRADIVAQKLPYLVAERDGKVAGYAYAGLFRTRSAYRYAVEDSIYVAADAQRLGLGRRMLETLVVRCTGLGYRQMLAVIGDSANAGSIGVHSSAGFSEVARLPAVGFKFKRWVDCVIMQRALGPGAASLPDR